MKFTTTNIVGMVGTDKIPLESPTQQGYVTPQQLSNFALKNGVITLGSDATNDMYKRAAGGTLQRIPIGTNGQVLQVVAGDPAWAAAPATITLASTLEATTGTDDAKYMSPLKTRQ